MYIFTHPVGAGLAGQLRSLDILSQQHGTLHTHLNALHSAAPLHSAALPHDPAPLQERLRLKNHLCHDLVSA